MKLIRIAGLILLAFLLLVSCSNAENGADIGGGAEENGAGGTHETVAGPEDDAPPVRMYANLPDVTFGGHEMRLLVRGEAHTLFAARDIYAEELNGELINDAVFHRNRAIEERFDVTISQEAVANPGSFIVRLINAGDDVYDALVDATIASVNLSGAGMLVDLKTVPHIDLSKPWWDQSLTRELTVGGRLFGAIGDLIISDMDGTWGVLFNKNMLEDFSLPNPYELVKAGGWTLDAFYEISRAVSVDVDGNGIFCVFTDMFGFATENYNIFVMLTGAGVRLAEHDADGLPVLTAGSPRFLAAYDKAVAIDRAVSTINAQRIPVAGGVHAFYDGLIPAFNEGRILFYMGSMVLVPQFRGMEQDFGILPIPKFDEAQENYYTTMSIFNNGAIYIPVTNDNLERTGILLEALSAESRYTLLPAYYDLTLQTKLARDEESSAMLDILFANRIHDTGALHNFGGILDLVTGGGEFVSGFERIEGRVMTAIQRLIDQLHELD